MKKKYTIFETFVGAEYCINRAIRLGYKAAGYHWEYINDNN